MLRAAAANKFRCVKLVMSCMNHVYVLEPGQLNEDRKAQQHHLSKISWRSLWVRGGGGGEECGEPDFADAEVSSPGPAPSDPSAAVETWTDTTDDCRSIFLFFLCLQHDLS